MVKPDSQNSVVYGVVKARITRPSLSPEQRRQIAGDSKDAVALINEIDAALMLDDRDALLEMGDQLVADKRPLTRVWRYLGLTLLGQQRYGEAASLLRKYLDFALPDQRTPNAEDIEVMQQQAIALSGLGEEGKAVTMLKCVQQKIGEDAETLGILGGRIKRAWLRNESKKQLGFRALEQYRSGLAAAKKADPEDHDQVLYNGINAAYLGMALGEPEATWSQFVDDVANACTNVVPKNYWSVATEAEVELLMGRYDEAAKRYAAARDTYEPAFREWASTGQQALDIVRRQHSPPGAASVIDLFAAAVRDF
jgi:tetratricopeptide (TPR) repeat protein